MSTTENLRTASNKAASRQSVWLLSFSDLLTLILCFFLILVAGPVEQSQTRNEAANQFDSSDVKILGQPFDKTRFSNIREAGTELAILDSGTLQFDVWIRSSDFSTDGLALRPESLEKIKEDVFLDGYQLAGLMLALCAEADSQAESIAWFNSAGRILAVRSQLLDSGLYARGSELRPLGPNCQQLAEFNVDTSQQSLAGLISFRFTKAGHT